MNDIEYLKNNGVDVDTSIELLGDIENYNDTMQEFVNLYNDKLSKLKEYKDEGDLENYSIYAHSVKSDGRYLGFMRLSEVALNHEIQGKAGNKEFIDNDFDNLEKEMEKARAIAIVYLGDKAFEKYEVKKQTPVNSDKAVLIVDDSEIIRDFLYKILGSSYECIMADDGKKAISILEGENSNRIQAVFLDLNMPTFTGFDVLDHFKEKSWFNKFPVSVITGADDKESIEKAFTYPIVDMLLKPFDENEVRRIVDRTISFKE